MSKGADANSNKCLGFVRISLNLISIAIIVIPGVTVGDIVTESVRAVCFEGGQGVGTIGVIISVSIVISLTTCLLGGSNHLLLGDCSGLNPIDNIVSLSVVFSSQGNGDFLLVIFIQGVHDGLCNVLVTPALFVS